MADTPIFGLTYIPKDINLTLRNGTLTLKAGSKLYVPNGTGVFDTITTSSDVTRTQATGSDFFCYYKSGTIYLISPSSVGSGSTAPTGSTTMYWYDTTNNLAKRTADSGSTWTDGFTLPFARIKVSGGAISSIEQVFNGFGYVGSTFFALPGVSGYYPNGKEGFKNRFDTYTLSSVLTRTFQNQRTDTICGFTSTNMNYFSYGLDVVEKLPPIENMTINKRYYSKFDNRVYYTSDGTNISESNYVFFAYATTSASPYNIITFDVKNPFMTVKFSVPSDYAKYLANLLIIQYNSKPRASQTIECLGKMFPDELILSVRDGFGLDTATGKQLDILSKYIGASRSYTDSNNQKAVLNDEEFKILLKLKIIVNTGTATLYGLETNLYNLFENGIRVVETKDGNGNPNMGLTYYIRSDWANVGLAAVQQNILPHPTGVGYSYNLAAMVKYFGFIEYTDQSHPFTTGFRDYSDPTKDGEMYAYGKVIPN